MRNDSGRVNWFRILVVAMVGAFWTGSSASGLTLIENGRSSGRIYVKGDAPKDVQDAANELSRVLAQMSGAKLPVVRVRTSREIDRTRPAIVLGALSEQLGLKMNLTSRARDGFRYKVDGKQVLLVAESPRGVYLGACDFLESLGCGWYAPGKLGEVIPTTPTVTIRDNLDHSEVSNSIQRRFWYGGKNPGAAPATTAWLRRLNGNHLAGSWRHAWSGLVSPRQYFKEHPEYFSLNRGKRTQKQLCTTNADTIRIAAGSLTRSMERGTDLVYPAGPNDGGNLCECPRCAKLDTPGYLEPTSGAPACSSRIFKFASDVAEITSKKHPDRDLGVLVYSEYSRVPLKLKTLHPNVFPMIAPIRRCRLHGPGNPLCHWNKLWEDEIRGWAVRSEKLGFYIYNYNLADSLVPFSKIDFYRRLADEVNGLGVKQLAWTMETLDSWAAHAPHLYLSVRVSWNTNIDIDAEMDRFFNGFYGEAAAPMKRYWLRIDKGYATTNTHTGSQYGLHHVWTGELLAASRRDIDAAKRLAKSERVKEAVAMAEAGLRCAELFRRIWDGIGDCEFLAAAQAQDELQSHIHEMAQKPEPRWAHERYAWKQYYRRFLGLTVDSGAEILKNGGKILVKLPDVWKFAKDAKGIGAARGWFTPTFNDAAWKKLATFSKSWVDQGLGWYHGDAWYRTRFRVPGTPRGADLRLWFGGFDYNVDVYLNGNHLGEKRGFAKPAEFDNIAKHLKFGGENVLAVRVSSGGLAELGTGGIMMPVIIYQAKGTKPPSKTPTKEGPAYEM